MSDIDTAFLKSLLAAPGPSSFESKPAALWRERAEAHGATLHTDAYGNSFARFGQAKPRIMLAGHIDEIGLMVTYIDAEGLLYFQTVGGWDAQQLIGQRVRILGYRGEVLGVIGKKPIHLMDEVDRKKNADIKSMWIDIGAKGSGEAKRHVRSGDVAVIEQPCIDLLNGRMVSRALDNRLGAYIVLEAARRISETDFSGEVVAVATVQEEIGHIGAGVAAYGLEPDVAVAVDVTHATDVPDVSKKENGDFPLGSGAVISVGSVIHRGVFNALVDAAEAEGIPYGIEAAPRRTATDGDDTAKARGGVPTGVVSVPLRYMHSSNEMVDLDDVEQVIRLITAFSERLAGKDLVQP